MSLRMARHRKCGIAGDALRGRAAILRVLLAMLASFVQTCPSRWMMPRFTVLPFGASHLRLSARRKSPYTLSGESFSRKLWSWSGRAGSRSRILSKNSSALMLPENRFAS